VWFSAVVVFLLTGQPCFFGAEARGPFFPVICIFLLLYLFPSRERRRMYLWIGVFRVCFIPTELLFRESALLADVPRPSSFRNTISTRLAACSVSVRNDQERRGKPCPRA
jgi:hypothetical protein